MTVQGNEPNEPRPGANRTLMMNVVIDFVRAQGLIRVSGWFDRYAARETLGDHDGYLEIGATYGEIGVRYRYPVPTADLSGVTSHYGRTFVRVPEGDAECDLLLSDEEAAALEALCKRIRIGPGRIGR